jgi:hypothetical protein
VRGTGGGALRRGQRRGPGVGLPRRRGPEGVAPRAGQEPGCEHVPVSGRAHRGVAKRRGAASD